MNLSKEEQIGLKRIKKRNGEDLVLLPTDKSGRFAVMSMQTYIKSDEVHTMGDQEIGLNELKANQKRVNGVVSMLLKIFNIGKTCKHESRWRESTWMFYKVMCLVVGTCPRMLQS